MKNYKPQNQNIWQGRIDDEKDYDSYRWHQLINVINLNKVKEKLLNKNERGFCFLGFCCDLGVEKNLGRKGAFKGPASIRKAMANLPKSFEESIKMYDGGNVYCKNSLEKAQNILSNKVNKILNLGLFPVVLGGGHETAYGHYNGIVNYLDNLGKNRKPKIGIISLDSHFDLRPYERGPNSGTMFRQIADESKKENRDFSFFCIGIQVSGNTISLFKKAEELGVKYVLTKDINDVSLPDILRQVDYFIKKNDYIYLTICSDVFSSAFAPGVSSPQPLGLDPEIGLKIAKHIVNTPKIISFDIAEVSPRFDNDRRTAKLAAIIIFALINTIVKGDTKVET